MADMEMSETLSAAAAPSDGAKPPTALLKGPTPRLVLKLCGALLAALLLVLILRDPAEKDQGGGPFATPGVSPRSIVPPGLTCSNVDIASGARPWADEDPPAGWSVVYATVLQRHWDRWIYAHSLINNTCWPHQLDSTAPPMPEQCGYDTDSVWEQFPPGEDPYSNPPSAGSCFCPQLTLQGQGHATLLGQTLRMRYAPLLQSGTAACRVGAIGLETENAQKNEVSLQTAYESLCGHLPDTVAEYPKSAVIWEGGSPQPGTPFFLEQRICKGGGVLDQLEATATAAKENSSYWNDAHALALEVARAAGQPPPERADSPTMLDNIEDCIVSHACHGLDDTPSEFLSSPTLFTRTDTLETTNRAWAINYFQRQMERTGNNATYYEFCRRYYGYYFKVVLDRMSAARSAPAGTGKRLNLQVLSDSNITPLLTMLGAAELASRRPYWGSTLVFELWQQEEHNPTQYGARVIFNGQVLALGGACMGQTLCEWSAWQELLLTLIPTNLQCPEFYAAYRS